VPHSSAALEGLQPPTEISTPYQIPQNLLILKSQQFDSSMHTLLNNPQTVISDAVSLLFKIVSNVIKNPGEDKYRRLSSTNAVFAKKVGLIAGGSECMTALGFALQGTDWVLIPSAEAWEVLLHCSGKLEKFLRRLQAMELPKESSKVIKPSSSTSAVTVATNEPQSDIKQSTISSINTDAPVDSLNLIAVQQLLQALQSVNANTYVTPPVNMTDSSSTIDAGLSTDVIDNTLISTNVTSTDSTNIITDSVITDTAKIVYLTASDTDCSLNQTNVDKTEE
jgi:hypothetical protein